MKGKKSARITKDFAVFDDFAKLRWVLTIRDETIQLLRQRADLVALVSETVKLTRRGRSWLGLCPFHKERTPSFYVTPERGVFHCFGCGEHGNALSFVMKTEGLTFPDAVRRLAERLGIEVEETGSDQEKREQGAVRRARDELYEVGAAAAVYYETMLQRHPDARVAHEELQRRELVVATADDATAQALRAFRLGYAPAGWDGLATYLREQGMSLTAAERVGLVLARSSGSGYYDRFRNRLMFAICDVQGRVVGFSGRVLADPRTGVTDQETGKYINSPESPIFQKGQHVFGLFQARQAIRKTGEAIVVEGNFDVVSLHARGIGHVVAPLGTAFTEAQAQILKRYAPTVVLLFDGDRAGKKALRAAREPCQKAGLAAKAALLPLGTDPDELARTHGIEAVQRVVHAAKGLLEHLIAATLDETFVRADAQERSARMRDVLELIRTEEDPSVRAMSQTLADTLVSNLALVNPPAGRVDFTSSLQTLTRQVQRSLQSQSPVPQDIEKKGASHETSDPVMLRILGCLLDFPVLLADDEVREALVFLQGEVVFVIANLQKLEGDPSLGLDTEDFLAHVPQLFHSFVRHRQAVPFHHDLAMARTELLANGEKLRSRTFSRENQWMGRETARAEALGQDEKVVDLLREVQERARRKRGIA